MVFHNILSRSASIATANYLSEESDWMLLPCDESGLLLVRYAPKICTKWTGFRATSDLLLIDGMASQIAATVARIARRRGVLQDTVEATGCRVLRKAIHDLELECPAVEPGFE